jgi:hypothetical protein
VGVLLLSSIAAHGQSGVVVKRPGEIEFTATVNSKAFDSGLAMPGYHAIVWKDGKAAHAALLEADVSDRQVLESLEGLGAKPGDTVIAGPEIEVLLRLPGREGLVPLSAVLEDPAGRGLSMRFGGNEVNIPKWKSGCIVCLYSCPGSKVGNAKYTVRDYAKDVTRFRVRPGILPRDGTPIRVVLRLASRPVASPG